MDLRQLKQFVVLATELNYRKAAERLNMTQPPLSIAIKKLEAEIGTPLFERDRLGVRLTVAGGAFLGEARRLLDGAESALAITRDAAQGRIGTLRVCAVPSASLNLLPKVLPVFARRFPQIRLRLSSGSTVGILGELQRDELDAAFLVPPASRVPGAEMLALAPQRLILAVPADHWAAGGPAISLSELGDETLVTLAHSDSPGFAGSIAATCQQAGFHPRVLQESSHALISLPLVAAGHGIAIVPEAHRRIAIENVAYVDVSDASGRPLTYAMSLAVRQNSPNPAVAPFIETVRDVLEA
ncbi:LysR substrate-binding domain-containing protein [Pigmentiphaga sp.]|uniref:LysR family transcriptional regulator n=1 Tax=Pigmentiphaga sp. TaxID=1977564 RepID=UPI00128C93FE|nr:LysR substrate-binding domain-containing protein [Pigmentiphaga sp.]MPS25385.1 LysR family transcriptional regulator [Alcaligenaceae bacterium SAGV5]MPS53999.1 LysR family transcriptional regulator [Alcaligenaceae bacterium SAGV3]MPT59308.1 LysR family transcriptional regulator [Alcaligenaceae bacterium]